MPGRYGLLLVVFAILVWLARWLDIGGMSQLPLTWFQAVNLLCCLGLAICLVGVLKRCVIWAQARRG
jgi:hypothetical protein